MADERIQTAQQTLPFALADGSARDRRVQLARAIRDLRLDAYAKLLALLVFDMTGEGIGEPWSATDETVLGHALGPECERTKFYRLLRALTDAGILTVDKAKADNELSRRYSIQWEGVYAARGLPLPSQLGADPAISATRKIRITEIRNAEIRNTDEFSRKIRNTDFSEPETRNISAHARLSSCLLVLSYVVVDDDKRQGEIRAKANEILHALYATQPTLTLADQTMEQHSPLSHKGAKVDDQTRQFLARVAAIAVALGGEWAEWIDYAVAITRRAKPKHPGAYLRNTLRNALVEFAGLCDNDEEAGAAMGKLLAAARPLVKPILAHKQSDVSTPMEVT
jgi:hypothetical protein